MIAVGPMTAESVDLPNTGYELHQSLISSSIAYLGDFEIQFPGKDDTMEKTESEANKILERLIANEKYLVTNGHDKPEAGLEGQKQARAIIRVPPKEETKSHPAYHELRYTNTDKEIIGYIISSMGTQSYFWLFRNSSDLKEKGKQINDVHPLKFLETIFSPEGRSKGLRDHMEVVMDSRFTRTNFIEGLGSSLTRKSMEGDLHIYREDFAKAVEIQPHEIHTHFQNHDWEGMVRHLMKIVPRP